MRKPIKQKPVLNPEFFQKVGRALRYARIRDGRYTQQNLAKKIGVSNSHLCDVEMGHRTSYKFVTVYHIIDTLELDFTDFINSVRNNTFYLKVRDPS